MSSGTKRRDKKQPVINASPSSKSVSASAEDESTDEERPSTFGRFLVAVVAVISLGFMYSSYALDLGTLSAPGPGLWPLVVSSLTFIVAAMLIIRGTDWQLIPRGGRRLVLLLMAALVAYCALLPLLGFILATIPLLYFFTSVVGQRPWKTGVITAVLTVGISYLIFSVALGVPLVSGIFS